MLQARKHWSKRALGASSWGRTGPLHQSQTDGGAPCDRHSGAREVPAKADCVSEATQGEDQDRCQKARTNLGRPGPPPPSLRCHDLGLHDVPWGTRRGGHDGPGGVASHHPHHNKPSLGAVAGNGAWQTAIAQ